MRIATVLMLMMVCSRLSAAPDGERIAYMVGCVNCHHQTPKEMINAPSLEVVKAYSLAEFEMLLRTGKTRAGRDLLESSSLMGIVAVEQLRYLSDQEIAAVHAFLRDEWNAARSQAEEAKIPGLYHAIYEQGDTE